MKFNSRICAGALFLPLLMLTTIGTTPVVAALQQAEAAAAKKPVVVEWVYRIQYGHQDEWWRIFKKYQIAILDRQKQLGYVKEYTVFAPSLHTSEDALRGSLRAKSPNNSSLTRQPSSEKRIAGGSLRQTIGICLSTWSR
jgi:hypothetical protein